jgi:hypothetical protein
MKSTLAPLVLFPFFLLNAQAATINPEAIWTTVRLSLRHELWQSSEPRTDPAQYESDMGSMLHLWV